MIKKLFKQISLAACVLTLFACGEESATKPESEDLSSSAESSVTSSAEATISWRDYCLEVINQYRATEGLTPYALAADSLQECADQQSNDDLASNKAHGHFGACKESAQNSGPNIDLAWYSTEKIIVDTYLEMMWNEKKLVESGERDPEKKEDFSYIGHYLSMSSKAYKTVACGIAKDKDGKQGWFNINFYR